MKFTRQQFAIAAYNYDTQQIGTQDVQGYVAEESGLGYYEDEMERYIITHLASGYTLGYIFYIEKETRACIEAIIPLLDWHMPAKAFFALPIEDLREVRNVMRRVTTNFDPVRSMMSKNRANELLNKGREYAEAQ